jgi:hypothetical protein
MDLSRYFRFWPLCFCGLLWAIFLTRVTTVHATPSPFHTLQEFSLSRSSGQDISEPSFATYKEVEYYDWEFKSMKLLVGIWGLSTKHTRLALVEVRRKRGLYSHKSHAEEFFEFRKCNVSRTGRYFNAYLNRQLDETSLPPSAWNPPVYFCIWHMEFKGNRDVMLPLAIFTIIQYIIQAYYVIY